MDDDIPEWFGWLYFAIIAGIVAGIPVLFFAAGSVAMYFAAELESTIALTVGALLWAFAAWLLIKAVRVVRSLFRTRVG